MHATTRHDITAATWNLAAVNNNPFEYWITHDDPAYVKLMKDVEAGLDVVYLSSLMDVVFAAIHRSPR